MQLEQRRLCVLTQENSRCSPHRTEIRERINAYSFYPSYSINGAQAYTLQGNRESVLQCYIVEKKCRGVARETFVCSA